MFRRTLTRRHLYVALLTGACAFSLGSIVGEPAARAFFSADFLSEWYRVGKVMRLAQTRFVDAEKVSFDHLARNAAAGAVGSLDRYTEYLDAEDFAVQNAAAEQRFTGIGVLMRPVDGLVVVDRVYPGGGAEAAGIRRGDRLVAAGDSDLSGLSLDEVSPKIKGAEGTAVDLTIRRPGVAEPLVIKVTRRTITVSTVGESRILEDGKTGLVVLNSFERRSPHEVRAAIDALRGQGATRIVLDLRGNPGGLVDAAVGLVGLFCPKNTRVVTLAGRTAGESHEYRTEVEPAFPRLPLIVLTDRHSASASEIFAGAMRDHRRAPLVGTRTFGKGLVQSIYKLDDTTGLKITTARYLLPSGAMIHGTGVAPDIVVALPPGYPVRRQSEEAQLAYAGGPEAFFLRHGYEATGDETLATAVALFDSLPSV